MQCIFQAKKHISSGITFPSASAAPVVAAAPPPKATSPSDDLLQLDAAFSSSIPQPTSKAFSPSTNFPPSQPFPGMQSGGMAGGFGPSPWGNAPVSAPSTGEYPHTLSQDFYCIYDIISIFLMHMMQ